MTITNSKILSVGKEVEWASFHGFSLLFDNPGSPFVINGGKRKLLQVNIEDTEADFYKSIWQGVQALEVMELGNAYGFCPLPTTSYHVTVYDGINVDNLAAIKDEWKEEYQHLVKELPYSLNADLLDLFRQHELTKGKDWNISFRFNSLAKWSNSAIVVRLEPADAASQVRFEEIESQRRDLAKQIEQVLGMETTPWPFSPHITLGYFANRELAARTSPFIERWTEQFRQSIEDKHICFSTIGLYGFTDMVSFFT